MEKSELPDNTIELGRKIAKDLGASSRSDFLGGWMAHYIAELIGQYDKASGTAKERAGEHASNAILKLWKHRYQSTSGFDVFKRASTILETLNQLDPKAERPFYFRHSAQQEETDGNDVEKLKELALGVDRTARRTLRAILLLQAHVGASEDTKKYLKLSISEHLTDDLEALAELTEQAEAKNFSDQISKLLKEIKGFGDLCISFGEGEKEILNF